MKNSANGRDLNGATLAATVDGAKLKNLKYRAESPMFNKTFPSIIYLGKKPDLPSLNPMDGM
jgi:hypothetical protein